VQGRTHARRDGKINEPSRSLFLNQLIKRCSWLAESPR